MTTTTAGAPAATLPAHVAENPRLDSWVTVRDGLVAAAGAACAIVATAISLL